MAASVQVVTETEKPGLVMVRAVATGERAKDGRPVAGFFVRRRYDGDRFMIAKPEEFSANWMRFEDQPPKEWVSIIKKRTGVDAEDLMYQPPPDPVRANPFPQQSLLHMQTAGSNQMDGNGRISQRSAP